MRKLLASFVAFSVCLGFAIAEEFGAEIRKVDGNKVTVQKMKRGADKKFEKVGDEVTLTAAPNVRVVKAKFNQDTKKVEAGDPIEGGLKSEALSKGPARGTIVTDGSGNITEIRVFQLRKKDN